MNKVTIQVPATSANCGPGYDTLGLACTLYNDFAFELLDNNKLELSVIGEGADYLTASKDNLTFKGFFNVWNTVYPNSSIGLKVTMHNRIPMSRGLGSSSSAIVAGICAANTMLNNKFTKEELLNFATALEGHPDNVAPAIFGGFTISYMEGNKAYTLNITPAKPLKLIAVVPDKKLATALARKAIPEKIDHKSAVYNVSRASLLIGALTTGKYEFLHDGLMDQLHQPFRAHLIPGLKEAFQAAIDNGAYNAIISGAGSTVMAYAPFDADHKKIAEAMQQEFVKIGINADYHILDLDYNGAKKII